LFVTAAGHGTCLAVLTASDADVGLIAYEMAMLITSVGHHLSSASRTVELSRP
jgi:predicted regulator of Ras-like GTPase activity (Roadblock/LC7/MglB family)